ncbi:1-cys-glutaredoxin-like protein-1, putative [Babesia caballi]|uniref:1-cys-glutaredoxin-like protein-1, putative n=1 Tax=Babesia caballi TaxID=5871 RepID=A0AAV4LWH5_BABCB|nr:1-cys-glutaredoxin-like protein-1, putative [Babesia caballi]
MTPFVRVHQVRILRGNFLVESRHGTTNFNLPSFRSPGFRLAGRLASGVRSIPATVGTPAKPSWNALAHAAAPSGLRPFTSVSALEQDIEAKLRDLIRVERVLLLLKGTPEAPQCGFSAAVVSILDKYKVSDYAYVDVLSHELLRPCAKRVAKWPTFPQLFVNGNLVGGCDVIQQLHESGSLAEILCGAARDT